MENRIEEIVKEYREIRIKGKCIDLIPFTMKEAENVVQIRNQEKNKYFLNQTQDISVEGQKKWYASYQTRYNDIYWCIYAKNGTFLGTIRLYDIDEENNLCNQGSFMIDEAQAEGAPYAIEAELLTLDFIFEVLKIGTVINEDRVDNKVMNNLSKKIGFEFQHTTIIHDIEYNYYLLKEEQYQKNREKFSKIIEYWAERE